MEDKNLKGHAALFTAYLIFGLNTPVSKAVLADGNTSPLALTFFRFAGAATLFWIASLFVKREKVCRRDLFLFFVASMFGILINQMAFIVGLSMASPIDASVITTMVPILTMLLAALFLGEPITWKKAGGVLVGAAGALLLIFNGNPLLSGSANRTGDWLCVLSCTSFALYLTAFKKLILRYSAVTSMKWMFLYATVVSLPFCRRDIASVPWAALSPDGVIRIAYVVVAATFIAYLLIPPGQKSLRPTVVSMYNYLQPIVASAVAVATGMDAFGWSKGIASLLVFFGVYLVTQSKSRAQLEAERQRRRNIGVE
ncbi:MAG: DMT family transporter [Tannerella sp.]|jgi:drug/metabolite transporter (DMT)-like permease|nr:DMT family transporter [Tannerella sp.]